MSISGPEKRATNFHFPTKHSRKKVRFGISDFLFVSDDISSPFSTHSWQLKRPANKRHSAMAST